MTTWYTEMDSPLQTLVLTSNGKALTGVYMTGAKGNPEMDGTWTRDDEAVPFPEAKRQLEAYFRGTLEEFDLPLEMAGTRFQKSVWEELRCIPYGQTISYGELARRIGNPKASRAVGLANGRNPVSIIVPCHRVIGAAGQMVGYGGGLPRKEILLQLEARKRDASQANPHARS